MAKTPSEIEFKRLAKLGLLPPDFEISKQYRSEEYHEALKAAILEDNFLELQFQALQKHISEQKSIDEEMELRWLSEKKRLAAFNALLDEKLKQEQFLQFKKQLDNAIKNLINAINKKIEGIEKEIENTNKALEELKAKRSLHARAIISKVKKEISDSIRDDILFDGRRHDLKSHIFKRLESTFEAFEKGSLSASDFYKIVRKTVKESRDSFVAEMSLGQDDKIHNGLSNRIDPLIDRVCQEIKIDPILAGNLDYTDRLIIFEMRRKNYLENSVKLYKDVIRNLQNSSLSLRESKSDEQVMKISENVSKIAETVKAQNQNLMASGQKEADELLALLDSIKKPNPGPSISPSRRFT